MRHVIAGTAGHIDHGKTRLVKALTGIDCDRLGEEKERGIDDELHIGFIDVPGHERFVKNMLAGASGIDLVIMVVAADESVKPQTREHFEVCRLLGIGSGIVAMTKSDLADAEMRELVALEIQELVRGSFLDGAPIIPVSAATGEGLDDLKAALAAMAGTVRPRASDSFFRLPVDRAFTIKGFGTVVTGTLVAGAVGEGDEIVIHPSGRIARVRGIQVHGETVERAVAGQRTALNLLGIDVAEAGRGSVLAPRGCLNPSRLLDVSLRLLPDARAPLRDLARVRYHQGTSEILARVRLLEAERLEPGSEATAQLRLESPAATLPGERFVIRQYSPMVTIGGGIVLDGHPEKHRGRSGDAAEALAGLRGGGLESLLAAVLERSPEGLTRSGMVVRTGLLPEAVAALAGRLCAEGRAVALGGPEGRLLSPATGGALRSTALALLEGFHRGHPLAAGMPREELLRRLAPQGSLEVARAILDEMAKEGTVRLEREFAAAAGHRVELGPDEERIRMEIDGRFEAAGLNPPGLEQIVGSAGFDAVKAQRIYHLLVANGRLVRIKDGKVFHATAIEGLKRLLWKTRLSREIIDVAAFKELTGTSRKLAIPLLEHMDAEKVTRRRQNDREILPPHGSRET
jgi:selenocysteine-specific elongation factor